MNEKIVQYIIRFLLGEDISGSITATIGYTADRTLFPRYNIVIIPSGFFAPSQYGHPSSLPLLPLQEIEGVPLLFGSSQTETVGATLVIHADIIASTYFLISRYEEMICRKVRDTHGRFPGKESLPYRAGFIHRPIVDEYRLLLRRWLQQTNLNVPEVKKKIQKVYLTHDVDAPFLYRSWKGFIRSLQRGNSLKKALQYKFGPVTNDPFYTFPLFWEIDNFLQQKRGSKHCQSIYFFKAGGKGKPDKPHYQLQDKDIQQLLQQTIKNKAVIGLHSSYQAGINPLFIAKEKEKLEKAIHKKITFNRHHFLANREPEDMLQLEANGITDDFTMGYADVAGFRLGTSYPVQWINPVNRRLSPLRLHPLLIMDCSLEEPKYMHLTQQEAEKYSLGLIEEVQKVGGEISLLWHNNVLADTEKDYQQVLYTTLIHKLASL